jgi:hypothetical protein
MPKEAPVPVRGHLVLDTNPNPLVAHRVGDDLYEFAFDIIMREAGGVDVRIEDFTVEALAFRTMVVRSQTFPATEITGRGYPASIAAGKYLQFHFVKRWNIPHALLTHASLHVVAHTIDANGRRDTTDARIGVVTE